MPHKIRKERNKISLRHIYMKGKNSEEIFSWEALFYALPKGALTLEAALVLPIFVFAAVTILSLFLMMRAQYIVGNSLDLAIADTALLREKTPKQVETLTKAAFYKELAVQKCPLSMIKGGIAGFSWKDTDVDKSYVDASVTYQIRFPLRLFGISGMKVSDKCRIHRWTGRQNCGVGSNGETWVFVTPTQSVYHENRECSHLKLSVKPVQASVLNKGGNSYVPCGHCAKGQAVGGIVYVTAKGECYHYRIGCSGLKRTIYMVKKSQTWGKGPCSRCGGK